MNEPVTSQAHRKYGSIEALRFFAALLVVFVHIPGLTLLILNIGVDIFFVLSGFVMLLSTECNGLNFFQKRLIRILPTYYFFTLGVFFVAMTMPNLLNSTTASPEHLLKSLLFIPFDKHGTGHFPILFLGWSLNYEMYFYALFAIALKLSHEWRAIITTVFLALFYALSSNTNMMPFKAYSDSIVMEFALGMIVYELVVKLRWIRAAVIAFMLITALIYAPGTWDDRFYIAGLPSAVFVALCVIFLSDKYIPKHIYLLGGSSYALYLTHPYIIQIFDKVTGWFQMDTAWWWAAFAISILLVNIVAVLVFKLMEIPTTAYLRRKILG